MSIDAQFQRAAAAQLAGDFALAERIYRDLIEERPLWAQHNLGVMHTSLGQFEAAEQAYLAALEADLTAAFPRHALARLWLAQGRYAEAWPLFEARREIPSLKIPSPNAPYLEVAGPRLGGVGVVTRGNPAHANDRNRSLTGAAAARLAALGRDLAPESTGARDFHDTARIVAGLDLVIAVDTSIVHLAGAMGKPCWALLPTMDVDWRWGLTGETTAWYDTLKLYRQDTAGDWSAVLDRVEADLSALGSR